MVGKLFLALGLSKEEYVFELKKGLTMTHIYGPGYQQFVQNYELKIGDRIRVELNHPAPYFHITGEGVAASPTQSEDNSEDNVFDDEGTVIVNTNGLKLTNAQTGNMNNHLAMRAVGIGVLLHIPKKVVSALKIRKKGWAKLTMADGDNFEEAAYYTSSDGRIKFKSGWEKFNQRFNLQAGLVVLVSFHTDTDGFMNMSSVVL